MDAFLTQPRFYCDSFAKSYDPSDPSVTFSETHDGLALDENLGYYAPSQDEDRAQAEAMFDSIIARAHFNNAMKK